MLTTEDKEDIRRIIAETLLAKSTESSNEEQVHDLRQPLGNNQHLSAIERQVDLAARILNEAAAELVRLRAEHAEAESRVFNEGLTDLTFVNPKTGEARVVEVQANPIVEVTARAMEVFGAREKALRWLNSPVRSLGDQTPLSLLNTPEGVARVQDTLGRVEHGVW
ncbi:hypothetical protein SBA6_810011 [Candidatus Sulfopaludibacter sp. SbA6]|nr:hypothetical protein SBA6_810011 [Candidatus Sulfopaludibacter sp. SbA6]